MTNRTLTIDAEVMRRASRAIQAFLDLSQDGDAGSGPEGRTWHRDDAYDISRDSVDTQHLDLSGLGGDVTVDRLDNLTKGAHVRDVPVDRVVELAGGVCSMDAARLAGGSAREPSAQERL